jgi:hypothetical protein
VQKRLSVASRAAWWPYPFRFSLAARPCGRKRAEFLRTVDAAMSKVPCRLSNLHGKVGRTGEFMQVVSWISFYTPVVIIILAVVAVLFSFFWVFLPLPRWMSNAMRRLLVRLWR